MSVGPPGTESIKGYKHTQNKDIIIWTSIFLKVTKQAAAAAAAAATVAAATVQAAVQCRQQYSTGSSTMQVAV
jgi:hypothetical protein